MKDYIYTIFQESGSLSTEEIFLHILVASILACVIYLSYYFTHAGGVYSKKFNVSLITLTILTATVMTVIGNNIALSLGMARRCFPSSDSVRRLRIPEIPHIFSGQ